MSGVPDHPPEPAGSAGDGAGASAPALAEHFFRHEYGRLVAVLTRKVGVGRLDLVEDAVQGALASALMAWTTGGLPTDPGAWLFRVAYHHLIGDLRRTAGRQRILQRNGVGVIPGAGVGSSTSASVGDGDSESSPLYLANEVRDDLLRMLFICCDDVIPRESQLALALKTLCGFSAAEIALRLFTTEVNVHKRLVRAREPSAPGRSQISTRRRSTR